MRGRHPARRRRQRQLFEPDDLLEADHVPFSPRIRRRPMRQESA
jgi:hypothetical protein